MEEPGGLYIQSMGSQRVRHDSVTCIYMITKGFLDSSVGKESTCNAGDPISIPGSGRSSGEGIGYPLQYSWASLVTQLVKNPPAVQETWSNPWVGKIPWRRERLPTLVFWPREFHRLYNTVYRVTKSQTRLSNFHFHGNKSGQRHTSSMEESKFTPGFLQVTEAEWLLTPVFWPGEFHGLYSPWGCKESDTTDWLSHSQAALNFACILSH